MRWQAYFTTVQHLAQYSIHNPNLELLRQDEQDLQDKQME